MLKYCVNITNNDTVESCEIHCDYHHLKNNCKTVHITSQMYNVGTVIGRVCVTAL